MKYTIISKSNYVQYIFDASMKQCGSAVNLVHKCNGVQYCTLSRPRKFTMTLTWSSVHIATTGAKQLHHMVVLYSVHYINRGGHNCMTIQLWRGAEPGLQ